MVLQNYQNFIEFTLNMIYFVAFDGGLKCPRKIHLNAQWGEGMRGVYFSKKLTTDRSKKKTADK
jgi:hypothetical protein